MLLSNRYRYIMFHHFEGCGLFSKMLKSSYAYCMYTTSVTDPYHFDADPDPDPGSHFDAEPDPIFQFDADPDPSF